MIKSLDFQKIALMQWKMLEFWDDSGKWMYHSNLKISVVKIKDNVSAFHQVILIVNWICN